MRRRHLLITFFCLAVFFRLYIAFRVGFWIDETYDLDTAHDNRFVDILLGRHWDAAHPPLFFMVNKLLAFLWQDITILRLVSIAVSSVGLWRLASWLEKEGPPLLGIFSLLLVGSSYTFVPLHVVSQSYPWVFTLVVFSVTCSFDCLYRKVALKTKHWIFLGFLYFATFFMDYSGVWSLISLACFFLVQAVLGRIPRDRIIFLVKVASLAAGLFLLWSPVFFRNLQHAFSLEGYIAGMSGYLGPDPWLAPLRFWMGEFSGYGHILGFFRYGDVGIAAAIVVSLLGMGYIGRKNPRLGAFIIVSSLLPIAVSHGYSVVSGNEIFHARNLWFSQLAFLLGYAGFGTLLLRFKAAWIFILALAATYIYDFPNLGYRPALLTGNEEGAAVIVRHLKRDGHQPGGSRVVLLSSYKPYRLANTIYHIRFGGYEVEFPLYSAIQGYSNFDYVIEHIGRDTLEGRHVYLVNIHADLTTSERAVFDAKLIGWASKICRSIEFLEPTEKTTLIAKCHF